MKLLVSQKNPPARFAHVLLWIISGTRWVSVALRIWVSRDNSSHGRTVDLGRGILWNDWIVQWRMLSGVASLMLWRLVFCHDVFLTITLCSSPTQTLQSLDGQRDDSSGLRQLGQKIPGQRRLLKKSGG